MMIARKLLRTVLFVPGNKPHMLDKARALAADAVILNLEDGVPLDEKPTARAAIRAALSEGDYGPQAILRVNAWGSGLVEKDLEGAFHRNLGAVCLSKAESAADVERLALELARLEGEEGLPLGSLPIDVMVETARGVLNAFELARSPRVRALLVGGEDLALDLGAIRTREGKELAYARAHIVLAARAAGAMGIDTIYTDLADSEGLYAEARQARELGYSGKLIIHPAQIEPVQRAFAPSAQELVQARRILEAFEAAEARGDGVIALDGQMIDAPVVSRARDILALANIIPPCS